MAQAQKPDLVFQRNERVHVFRWGSQFSRPLAALQSTSLNKRCTIVSKYVCQSSVRVQDTPTIRVFPLHFSSPAHPCAFSYRKHYTGYELSKGKDRTGYHSTALQMSSQLVCQRPSWHRGLNPPKTA